MLLATAFQMVEVSSLRALLRSTRGDAVVLVVTALATVAFDLVTAVLLGLVVAGIYALRQVARSARLDEIPLDDSDHTPEEQPLIDEHIVAYRLEGPLFFGAAHSFLLELSEVSDVRVVVLRHVAGRHPRCHRRLGPRRHDQAPRRREASPCCCPGYDRSTARSSSGSGVYDELAHERHVFDTTPEAIAHARVHAARVAHVAGGGQAVADTPVGPRSRTRPTVRRRGRPARCRTGRATAASRATRASGSGRARRTASARPAGCRQRRW